jgi:hypothetical protein
LWATLKDEIFLSGGIQWAHFSLNSFTDHRTLMGGVNTTAGILMIGVNNIDDELCF